MAGRESSTFSAATDLLQLLVPMLKGANYKMWSLRMKTLFMSQELWDLVEKGFEGKEPAKPDKKLKKNRINDAKALFFIQQALDDEIFPHIASATTSNQAWNILKQQYLGHNKEIGGNESEIKEETSITVSDHDGGGGESASPRESSSTVAAAAASSSSGKKEDDDKEENFENAMLVVLTLIITFSYQALLNPPSTLFKPGYEIKWACLLNLNSDSNCPEFTFLVLNTAIFMQSVMLLLWTLRGRREFLLGGLAMYLTFCYFILLIPFSHYIALLVIPLLLLYTVYSATVLGPSFSSVLRDMKRKERRNP